MPYIQIDDSYAASFIKSDELTDIQIKIKDAHKLLYSKQGPGNEFLGWVDYPINYDQEEFAKINSYAEKIKKNSDVFLVIGVGGSYLGAKAAIELLNHSFYNELPDTKRTHPKILFLGHNLSGTYIQDVIELIKQYDISVNVISKSGTTMETAVAFHLIKKHMKTKYSAEQLKERIFITTDCKTSILRDFAKEKGYTTFHIPQNIGGRYSVLTAVGLLPMAVSDLSISDIIDGASLARQETNSMNIKNNASYLYAALRNAFYQQGKKIELFVAYEPQFHYFQEWWKQLFGESEGKNGKGIFPTTALYSTDLHSLGQYIQEGERHLFQTILHVDQPKKDLSITQDSFSEKFLTNIIGTSVNEINNKIFQSALSAHTAGHVPNIIVNIPRLNSFTFGYLVYFFQKACAISSYMLGVNPFNQPGVETYKKNMKQLLIDQNKY